MVNTTLTNPKPISQPHHTQRESNIELLRIIAMLLVMVVHACFKSISAPTQQEIAAAPIDSFLRFFGESASIICVNVFVIISGWFGIKAKFSRISEFIFQVWFFGTFMYLSLLLLGLTESEGVKGWIKMFIFSDHWFVKSYIILYLFSPVLNAFILHSSQRQLAWFIIGYYCIQTLYGFYFEQGWFANGYSPLSFIGLYMLARYIRLYPLYLTQFDKWKDFLVYLCLTIAISLIAFYLTRHDHSYWLMYAYSSPLVILSAVYFFLFFSKLSFCNSFINWVAVSCFAAYLVHMDSHFFHPYYTDIIKHWFLTVDRYTFVGNVALLIGSIYTCAILIDKVRIVIWKCLLPGLRHIANKFSWNGNVSGNNLTKTGCKSPDSATPSGE